MLSRPIYEAMPKLYVGAGVLNVLLLDSPLKYLSGAMLIGAGILVTLWRHQSRTKALKRRPSAMRAPSRADLRRPYRGG